MSKKIFVFQIVILVSFMFGCSRNVKNTEIVFNNNELQLDSANKVKIEGRLKNGETGKLEANVNREKKIIKVDDRGNFSFYYQIKNLQDNKIYLGIKSNGTIIGNEIGISISKTRRNNLLINISQILDCYIDNGLNVENLRELQIEDYDELGLNIYPYSGVKFSTVSGNEDLKSVRILAFSNEKELDIAYDTLKMQAIENNSYIKIKDNNEINPKIHINPKVYSKYIYYIDNIQKFPFLRSWVYKTYVEDVGYLLVQQDAGVNSIVAGKHEEIVKGILVNNEIDNT